MRSLSKESLLASILLMLLLSTTAQTTGAQEEPAPPEGTKIRFYAITSHRYTFDDGTTYKMATITKLEDESICSNLARLKGQTVGPWRRIAADCVAGYTKDAGGVYYQVMFNEVFLNLPAANLYIAFEDESGYPTRVNFGDAPLPTARQLASTMVRDLQERGIEDARIIEPEP